MKDKLLKYLIKNSSLSKEKLQKITESIPLHTFRKGTILLRQGNISTQCFFVLKGCIRQYFYDPEGKERTINFFIEEQSIVDFNSYLQKTPSDYFLSCVEDSTLVIGNSDMENEMYKNFPELESINLTLVEQNFGSTQKAFASFMSSTAEERYLSLLKTRPELVQRVPQHQLASYLGITPESFSRIKKRLGGFKK